MPEAIMPPSVTDIPCPCCQSEISGVLQKMAVLMKARNTADDLFASVLNGGNAIGDLLAHLEPGMGVQLVGVTVRICAGCGRIDLFAEPEALRQVQAKAADLGAGDLGAADDS